MSLHQGQDNQQSQQSTVGGILIVLGIFLWYLSDGLVKLSNDNHIITVILYAVFFRGLALCIAQLYLSPTSTPLKDSFTRHHGKIATLSGALGGFITIAILMAEQYLPLMQVVLVLLTFPFFVILLLPFTMRLRISVRALLGVLLGFVGVSLTMNPHDVGGETIVASVSLIAESGFIGSLLSAFHPIYALKSEILVAYDWAFLASLLIAVIVILMIKRKNHYQALAMRPAVMAYTIVPLIGLIIANAMGYTNSYFIDFSVLSWAECAIILLAIATGFISMGLWHFGFVKNNFALGGVLTYSGFIWAGILDYLLFDIRVTVTTIVGMAIMTGAGIWGGKSLYEKNKDRLV